VLPSRIALRLSLPAGWGGSWGWAGAAQSNAVFGVPASSRTTLIISAGSNGLVR